MSTASGAEGIDPAQANVPPEWRQYPAFRMAADTRLTIEERSRGLSNVDDNRLSLTRNLWLDFDHHGFTVQDYIRGEMRRDWRLDMSAPFSLQSARQNADQLLVTEGAKGRAGVELRQPQLNLTTVARKESGSGAMPATGWDGRFESVSGTLYLPPGHRLIAALGTDSAPSTWWERWGLWNVFGVLLIVGFVYWAAGLIPAAIAALALLLTYQEAPAYIWLWGNLLAALSIARAAPEGRFRRFARAYRTVSFAVLGLALLPFLWMQVRYALYPQLEAPSGYSVFNGLVVGGARERLMAPQEVAALEDRVMTFESAPPPMVAAPAADAAASAVDAITAEDIGRFPESNVAESLQRVNGYALNSKMVVQRYAAGTVLQAGPGLPAWNFNAYPYSWSGPVETADSVRFVYVGPTVMFFWRLLGVVGLGVLFAWLALLSFGKTWRLPGLPTSAAAGLAGWLAPALLAVALLGTSTPGLATTPVPEPGAPPNGTLQELRRRLINAPPCTPSCAEITSGRVAVDGDRLEVTLQVSALANVAVAMPHASDRWQLDEVMRRWPRHARHRARRRRHALGPGDTRCAYREAGGPPGFRGIPPAGIPAAAARHRCDRARLDHERRQRRPAGLGIAGARARARPRRAGRQQPGARSRRGVSRLREGVPPVQPGSRLDDGDHRDPRGAATCRDVGGDSAGGRRVRAHRRSEGPQRRRAGGARTPARTTSPGSRAWRAPRRWRSRCRPARRAPRSGASS